MLNLNIKSLRAWSPAFHLLKSEFSGLDFAFNFDERPVAQEIPPSATRRLSSLTRISVDLGLQICKTAKADHIVFSSRHGEIHNATELLRSIGREQILSPTIFSQSVHNTSIGVLSLLQKNHAATTALASGANSFVAGLVSCAMYLQENPNSPVAYIFADEKISEIFSQHLVEENIPYAIAMLVTGSNQGLSLTLEGPKTRVDQGVSSTPQGILFSKWIFSNLSELILNGDTCSWALSRSLTN